MARTAEPVKIELTESDHFRHSTECRHSEYHYKPVLFGSDSAAQARRTERTGGRWDERAAAARRRSTATGSGGAPVIPVVLLLAGVVLLVLTWLSVLRTVFTPRQRSGRLMRLAVRAVGGGGAALA